MEIDTFNAIRSIVTPIILHACLDPLESHEVPYAIPHDTHQPAIVHYLLDLTQPLRQLTDLRTQRLHQNITATTATHLDPWRCYIWNTTTGPIPPNAPPPPRTVMTLKSTP